MSLSRAALEDNRRLAEAFLELARLTREAGDGEFKARAYEKAAALFLSMDESVRALADRGGVKGLMRLPGVGNAVAKKTVEFYETGRIGKSERLRSRIEGEGRGV